MSSAVESITVAVRDIEPMQVLFGTLGLTVESDTRASVSLLGAWRYPVHADVRLLELSSGGYAFGRLRLAQFAQSAPVSMAGTHDDEFPHAGPATLDVHVGTPVERVTRVLAAAGFEATRGDSRESAWRGPDSITLRLLTGVDDPPRSSLPAGHIGEVSAVSIQSADPSAAERFYQDGLGLVASASGYRDWQQVSGRIQVRGLADTVVPTQLHAPMPGHQLGINLLSLRCSELDGAEARLRALNVEIVTRPTHVALGDGVPGRVMLVRGPDRELIELIERDT